MAVKERAEYEAALESLRVERQRTYDIEPMASQDDPWESFAGRVFAERLRPVAYPQIPWVL